MQLLEVIVVYIKQEWTGTSVCLGHALKQDSFKLQVIHGREIKWRKHVLLKNIGVLLENLNFIRKTIVNDHDVKAGWWIN